MRRIYCINYNNAELQQEQCFWTAKLSFVCPDLSPDLGGGGGCIVKIAPGGDQMMSKYQASINLKHLPRRLLVSFAGSFNDVVKFIEEIHKIFLLNHQLNFFL